MPVEVEAPPRVAVVLPATRHPVLLVHVRRAVGGAPVAVLGEVTLGGGGSARRPHLQDLPGAQRMPVPRQARLGAPTNPHRPRTIQGVSWPLPWKAGLLAENLRDTAPGTARPLACSPPHPARGNPPLLLSGPAARGEGRVVPCLDRGAASEAQLMGWPR